jgi:hypothetical protein
MESNGWLIPRRETDRHNMKRNVKHAQLKLAATESKPESIHGFSWNFPGVGAEYVTRVAPGRPTV